MSVGGRRLPKPTPTVGLRLQRCGDHVAPECPCSAHRRLAPARSPTAGQRHLDDRSASLVQAVLRTGGQPLDSDTRTLMEARFGHDFSQIRVHTDEPAANSARAVDALAYTVGPHIVFAPGSYAPTTGAGLRLIAHELTHAVQQRDAADPHGRIEEGDAPSEREAQTVAARTYDPDGVGIDHRSTGPTLQRAGPAAPAAAVGIGALAAKCIVSAIIGVLADLGLQALFYSVKQRTLDLSKMTVDVCSLVLSAILGCIGGVVAAVWLQPWVDRILGPQLAGIAGPLIGRVLIVIARWLGVTIPKGLLKALLKLGCVSQEQAEVIQPGISSETGTASAATEPTAGEEVAAA
jgi:hypothetical protein